MKTGNARREAGFTYFGLLLAIATVALVVSAGASLLTNDLRRDKELELLFAGDEIKRALETYHSRNTGGLYPYPKQLDWLLRDPNQPSLQRYLRRIYRDPMHEVDEAASTTLVGTWVASSASWELCLRFLAICSSCTLFSRNCSSIRWRRAIS